MDDVRLFDANALINQRDAMFEIKTLAKEIARQNGGVDETVLFLKEAYDRIEAMPTIDAVPVVHARWVPNHGSYGTPHCSNCKWRIPYSEDSTLDARSFCPNCGAKMDAEEGDT